MLARVEASKSHDLAGISNAADGTKLSQELGGSERANANNGVEQIPFALHIRMLVDVVMNELFGVGNLRVEKRQVFLQMLLDGGGNTARLETVVGLLTQLLQSFQMAYQRLQMTPLWGRRCPQRWVLRAHKIRDKRGIQLIRFVAAQVRLGIALDPRRIDHTDGIAGLIQELCHVIRLTPCRFQTGMDACLFGVFRQPTLDLLEAWGIVAKLSGVQPFAFDPQRDLQRSFGDIDPHISHHLALLRTATSRSAHLARIQARWLHIPCDFSPCAANQPDSSTFPSSLLRGEVSLSFVLSVCSHFFHSMIQGASLASPGFQTTSAFKDYV